MQAKWMHPADLICCVMKRIYERNLTTLTGGNLSMMDSQGVMWVSPTGIDKGGLTRGDIVRVFPDGSYEGRYRPTSEYRIHHRIMKEHPEMTAVLHAHPPALVTMSVLHEVPDTKLTLASWEAVGNVGLTEYAFAGTLDLVNCVADTFNEGYSTAVLKNHATFLASQEDLFDAYRRFEQFNTTAELQLNAMTIGTLKSLTEEQINAHNTALKVYEPAELSASAPEELRLRKDLADLAHRAEGKKLFTAMFGSISARLGEDSFLINPQKRDNAYVTAGEFVRIDGDSCEAGKCPDNTAQLHQEIYRAHPEVQSVIIAAPVNAAAFAVTDRDYDVSIIPESYGVLRNSTRFSFDEYVSNKKAIAEKLDLEHPFGIVDNLGIVLAGPNPLLTFDKLEVAEFTAESIQQGIRSKKPIMSMTKEQQEEADSLS